MDKELQEKFFERFPTLFADRNKSMMDSCMHWGICFSKGWFNILWQACEKIEKVINTLPEEERNSYKFSQLKEKFGTLCIYFSRRNKEIETIINEAEALSAQVCEKCGAPGKLMNSHNWLYTACEEHKLNEKIKRQANS